MVPLSFLVRIFAAAAICGAATLNAAQTASAPPAPAAVLPPGNAEDGATVFKKCLACHQIGPTAKNGVGPVLNGIVGRTAGTFPGYNYSDANKVSGVVWTEATLAAYLPDPKVFLPGTKMTFAGLKMPQEVADVIAYLKQYDAQGNKAGR